MLFNSFEFILFFPIVFALYWSVPQNLKKWLILISSYYFYMCWSIKYVVLIFSSTLISYIAAILIERCSNIKKKKLIVWVAVVLCLLALFIFKYFNFFIETVDYILSPFSIRINAPTLKLMLPVGISFYTFQTLSYVIDVYRGEVKAEKNLGVYAAFISFFPQLVAGPIERTRNLLPQIKAVHSFNYDKAIEGTKLMLWGYYKKMAVADNLATFCDHFYGDPAQFGGIDNIICIVLFAFQIYCDFSGYSDIAIGVAKIMDIDLMTNFRAPYMSSSIKEFWQRWHISLSTWLRDYIYIPLGGSRCSKVKKYRNLMITFLLSGLWHGANIKYVIWGGIHGIGQIIEDSLSNIIVKIRKKRFIGIAMTRLYTFLFCCFAWIPFRAKNINDAFITVKHCFDGIGDIKGYCGAASIVQFSDLCLLIVLIGVLVLRDICIDNREKQCVIRSKALQWVLYTFLGLMILVFCKKSAPAEFVYFQF